MSEVLHTVATAIYVFFIIFIYFCMVYYCFEKWSIAWNSFRSVQKLKPC